MGVPLAASRCATVASLVALDLMLTCSRRSPRGWNECTGMPEHLGSQRDLSLLAQQNFMLAMLSEKAGSGATFLTMNFRQPSVGPDADLSGDGNDGKRKFRTATPRRPWAMRRGPTSRQAPLVERAGLPAWRTSGRGYSWSTAAAAAAAATTTKSGTPSSESTLRRAHAAAVVLHGDRNDLECTAPEWRRVPG